MLSFFTLKIQILSFPYAGDEFLVHFLIFIFPLVCSTVKLITSLTGLFSAGHTRGYRGGGETWFRRVSNSWTSGSKVDISRCVQTDVTKFHESYIYPRPRVSGTRVYPR